jgi:hypothetical protein
MESTLNSTIWNQSGASIDALENAIAACPENLWSDRLQRPEFWYVAYHTLFFLIIIYLIQKKGSHLRLLLHLMSWILQILSRCRTDRQR